LERNHEKPQAVPRKEQHRNWGSSASLLHKQTDVQPEKRLLLAVLADAIKCIQETRPSSKREELAEAATEWMLSNRREHPFCFHELCRALDWDPQQIRNTLMKEY